MFHSWQVKILDFLTPSMLVRALGCWILGMEAVSSFHILDEISIQIEKIVKNANYLGPMKKFENFEPIF